MFSSKQWARVSPMGGVKCGMVTSLVCLGSMMSCVPWSLAQQPPTGPPVHVPSEEEFSKQELEAFAEAYVALEGLQADQKETSQPGGAPAFSARMRQEIQSRGLTVERYKRISTAMNRDMTLRAKIKRLINEGDQ